MRAEERHAQRIDYEYERAGTASIFMFTEPLAGWREATARTSRSKRDWAVEVGRLMEGRFGKCPMVTLVCDNLNSHTIGAFYEAFPPTRARAIVRRLHFCHTPKHGSWLNIAENELSSLARRCEIGQQAALRRTLVLYRMVFGQSRQQDLTEYSASQMRSLDVVNLIENCRIDLSPPKMAAESTGRE